MKKTPFFLFVCASFFISCGKTSSGCDPVPVTSEKAVLVAYCQANNINYTEHSSGILYEIILPGSGMTPIATSTVSAIYTLKLLDNTQLQAVANPVTFSLSAVIDGWKIAIPLIKKGGRIKMVVPSALAYSCTGKDNIPPNTPLYFDVSLADVY
ncbi:FKBP-type peptidyl-prolyl cis-trans isomerase [Sediminibacterium ginsengisoli]|uniref:Peptidyl-prolyl cis-trans isomerase n=1 Tax=Sediminibacterium ginsengisoli TaxID=413434 RepID=A0A1T4PHT1_9BACT|nr:FKBP-type peptidyl-prolyl cis-trans isomerase [Sediminibacterium ginsengisoli]SJZ90786.1 FKBP-type peptidyl-prolyl cis-trans isomerase FkpA [Sediminibacterium ginsengisoli]